MLGIKNLKSSVAIAALELIEPGMVLGVGTGTTMELFIEQLSKVQHKIEALVASSVVTAQLLAKFVKLPIVDLNSLTEVDLYIDGADKIDDHKNLIKGRGGALTREKIIAVAARRFVCIVDDSKKTPWLHQVTVPVEVIPMARSYVARKLVTLGAVPLYRSGYLTDNGGVIIDASNFDIKDPLTIEQDINNFTGVIDNGIFAARKPDAVLIATRCGIEQY